MEEWKEPKDDGKKSSSQVYGVDKWQDLEDAVYVPSKNNYKVQGTLRLQLGNKRTFKARLDTDGGPKLVHPNVLPLSWERLVQETK